MTRLDMSSFRFTAKRVAGVLALYMGVPRQVQCILLSILYVRKLPSSSGVSMVPSLPTKTTVASTIRKNKDKVFTFMSSERGLVSDEFAPPKIENVGARVAPALRIALLSVVHWTQRQACRRIVGRSGLNNICTMRNMHRFYESSTMYA